MTQALRIGVAGLGTVGQGTLVLLQAQNDLIAERCGRPILVSAVSARDRRKNRGIDLSAVRWFDDAVALAADPEIDVVLELIGGADGIAKTTVERALDAGKPVITANKALLAHHGTELAHRAEAGGATLAYEAAVHVEGIREVSALDIAYAEELGYRIKLLGLARLIDGGVEQRVHPSMVRAAAPIANVEGVFNAVAAEGNFVDNVVWEGRGAGAGPTASAVVADLIDIARGIRLPTFALPAARLKKLPSLQMNRHVGSYYLRLMVVDKPGVLADTAAALRDEEISVEAMLQRGRAPGEVVPLVITTHETEEARMARALKRIGELDAVLEPPRMIRIEAL